MSWALKGLGGSLQEQIFPLSGATTLGRQGDIVVADSLASSIHARIGVGEDGSLYLEDNRSKNGTRVDGAHIDRVPLRHGLVFFIGDQGFEVLETTEQSSDFKTREKTPKMKQRPWYELMGEFLAYNERNFANRSLPLTALAPAVVLEFVRGVQFNSKWTLGYVPRKAGAAVPDLPIWEPGAPAVCFELLASDEGVAFKTAHSEIVRLNGEAIDSRSLRKGDTIYIHETAIEVDLIE